MYKITVVIPIYNVERYIEECLESVLVQLPDSVQVICVNDGTKDESINIAKSVLNQYDLNIQNQFIFLDQSNQGLSAARNTGIEAASGEYISFLDSDDKLKPGYFSSLLEALIKDDYDIIDFNFVTSEGVVKTTRKESFDSIFSSMTWYSWARLVKKKLFSNKKFTPGIYYEDIDLTPNLYIDSKKTLHLDRALYWYRTNKQGITQSLSYESNIKTLESLDYISNKYFELYFENYNSYHAFMAVQVYFLLCLNASRRFNNKKSFHYISNYQEKLNKIKIEKIPLSLFLSNPKILAFCKYPEIYLLGYKGYRSLKNSIKFIK